MKRANGEVKLWSDFGLQAQTVAWQARDHSTSVVHFALTASDGTSEHPGHCSADIRDLNSPPAIPVLHVSTIDLELLFSITQHKSSQGQCSVESLINARRPLPYELQSRSKRSYLGQQALAKLQNPLEDPCLPQHRSA